jgi:predicted aldo/keto reductase-like oxidoreductase
MNKNNKIYNRREFIARSFSGMASLGVLGVTDKTLSKIDSDTLKVNKNKQIICRNLGKTGLSIPVVSMGVMNNRDPSLIKKAYDSGIRHFDTAASYQKGQNEEIVGKIVDELKVREKVIIATKVMNPKYRRGLNPKEAKEKFIQMTEESLARLRTDYIDIIYLHSVKNIEDIDNPGIQEAMLLLKQQKKIRFAGFSTHSNMTDCINHASKQGFYDVILTAINYAMSDDNKLLEAIKNASSKGIGIVAMKTQCSQDWYRKREPEAKRSYYDGTIMQTAILKWVLRHSFITTAIPGFTNFQQLDEDFSIANNLEYTDEEKKFLKDRKVKLSMGYCRQCDKCIPSCPFGVDVPTLMRTYMYAVNYSNFYQARDTLESIPKGFGLEKCDICEICNAKCVNNIRIKERVKELQVIYS